MSKFSEFVDFIVMQELEQPDSIVRNYAIEGTYSRTPIEIEPDSDFVRLGMKRIGFLCGNDKGAIRLKEVQAELRSIGVTFPDWKIMAYLGQFWNYDRIKTGELKKWPLKKNQSSLDLLS